MGAEMVYVNDVLGEKATEILSRFEVVGKDSDDETLALCTAALIWAFPSVPERLRKMRNLRAVQVMTAGVDTLDFTAVKRGVPVFSNAGAYAEPVAEHAWGLALAAAKGVGARKVKVSSRVFRGGTLLVLGCGSIGSEVARIGRVSFSMRTVGVSRSFRSPELFDEKFDLSHLPSVARRADLIVDTLPLTVHTRSVLGHDALAATKETVVIVNVGRGATVDEQAMLMLLRERPETRYATDVFWERDGKEVYDTELWELPNFCGTLHNAGGSNKDLVERAQAIAAENLSRFLTTGSAANRVDPTDYLGRQ